MAEEAYHICTLPKGTRIEQEEVSEFRQSFKFTHPDGTVQFMTLDPEQGAVLTTFSVAFDFSISLGTKET